MKKSTKRNIAIAATATAAVAAACISGSMYLLHFALSSQRKTQREYIIHLRHHSPAVAIKWLSTVCKEKALRDTFAVVNGHRMHALYINAPKPTPKTAVLVHGYKDCSIDMLHIAYIYNGVMGYNVLLPDLYGHGKSEGDHINMGWLDRLDVMRWMDIANRKWGGNTQMVVHGISMGAATTMCVSGEKLPAYVKCFVEDCGYTSVSDEFAKQIKDQFNLPPFPLINVASGICKMRYGWSFDEASPLKQVAKCKLPMLLIHGNKDDFVPYSMLMPLFKAKPRPKEIYIARGSRHARAFRDHPDEYIAKVRGFVEQYIK